MRKQNWLFVLSLMCLLLFMVCPTNVYAYNYTFAGDLIGFKPGVRGTNGGEFKIYRASFSSNLNKWVLGDYLFTTWCLEDEEFMNFYNSTSGSPIFKVAGLSDYATLGGGSLSEGAIKEDGEWRDYISAETRWLYSRYLDGTLDDYTYNGFTYAYNSTDGARQLQNAIWFLEKEISSLTANLNGKYLVELALSLGLDAEWGKESVKVMNLVWWAGGGTSFPQGTKAQDQLAPVPEPATMLLLGTGLVGVAALGRRKLRKGSQSPLK